MGPSMRALLWAALIGTAATQQRFNHPLLGRQQPYTGPGRNSTIPKPLTNPLLSPVQTSSKSDSTSSTSLPEPPAHEEPPSDYDHSASETSRFNVSIASTTSSTGDVSAPASGTDGVLLFSYQPLNSQASTGHRAASSFPNTTSTSRTYRPPSILPPKRTKSPDPNAPYSHVPSGSPRASRSYAPPLSVTNPASQALPSRMSLPQIDACSGAIVNILDASLDWWYSKTYTQVESTIILQTNSQEQVTAWSVAPASTTLDITSAIADPTCTSTTAFNDETNETMMQYSCWNTPTPVAAVTTTVEQTAYRDVNITTGQGAIPDVVTSPTSSAALTVGNSSLSITSGAPVVHFSAYEVVRRMLSAQPNGRIGCSHHTKVHNMSQAYSFTYTGREDVNGSEAVDDGVTGRVQFAFLRALELPDDVAAGTFVADPTVVVVVEKVVAASVPNTGGIEQSASALETPSATLPSGLSFVSTTPTETGTIWVPLSPRVEQSDTALDVPTRTAHITTSTSTSAVRSEGPTDVAVVISPYEGSFGGSKITLAVPIRSGASQSVVTAVYEGQTITATAISHGGAGGEGASGLLVSAVAPPTNALGVLTQYLGDHTGAPEATIIGALPVGSSGEGSEDDGTSPGDSSDDSGSSGGSSSGGSSGGGEPGNSESSSGSSDWPTAVLTIGSDKYTATIIQGPDGATSLVWDGYTAIAGGVAVSMGSTTISVAPGGQDVVVAGTTTHLSFASPNPGAIANIPLITLGPNTYTANAATQFNIDGSIVTPGGRIVVSGTTISLASDATRVVVNGQTKELSAPIVTPAPLLTLDGTIYKPNVGSTYDIGSQLLVPGGSAVTISGQTISLLSGGSSVLVDGIRYPISAGGARTGLYPTITAPPVLVVDGQTFSPNGASSYIISGQTLTPGGAITFSGANGLETISLDSALNQVVTIANGNTVTSAIAGLIGAAPSGAPVLTINGHTYTAVTYNAAGSGATYIIDGQTLTPGGSIVLNSSTTISLDLAGTALIQGTSTSRIPGAYNVLPTAAPILTINGETFTAANDQPAYIINGKTLTPNDIETVTVDGDTFIVSLSPHATLLEIEELGPDGSVTSTIWETLFPASAAGYTSTLTSTARVGAATGASPSLTGSALPTATTDVESEATRISSVSIVVILMGCISLTFLF